MVHEQTLVHVLTMIGLLMSGFLGYLFGHAIGEIRGKEEAAKTVHIMRCVKEHCCDDCHPSYCECDCHSDHSE